MSHNTGPDSKPELNQAQYGYLPLLMSIGLALGMVIGSSVGELIPSSVIGVAVGAACWLIWRVSTRPTQNARESEEESGDPTQGS
ncbi:hypothetical protein [Microbacterium sp. GXS0129]|uniref:hypothetical protein n=1 Tax=Microbacterium sp. GXS0129 TaxID=3377836 RepID=UPI003839E82B